jgi:hypothetical protein
MSMAIGRSSKSHAIVSAKFPRADVRRLALDFLAVQSVVAVTPIHCMRRIVRLMNAEVRMVDHTQ